MTDQPTTHDAPLTAGDTIDRWLSHPEGSAVIGRLLEGMDQGPDVLDRIRRLPLRTLAEMSQGRLTDAMVEEMVRAVNGGELPAEQEAAPASARFAGRTVIVTGAASGIGRATAERLLAEGGRVIAVDLSEEGLAALRPGAGETVPVTADITREEDIARIVEAAGERVDGLANIAGIMDGMTPLHETDDQLWERVFSINVTGTFALTRAVLPRMLEARRGSIVHTASEASLRGSAAGTAYTASKHAVVGLTRSGAVLYGPHGIRTNAVAPGPTATGIEGGFRSEFAQQRLAPFFAQIPPVTTAQTLASSITWLLSDDAENINGQVLASDGGWSAQ
ncbi:SDR family NAD(P)-dependent oxidoreductase [Brachybacterium saurashtrense]|uniref:SDR family NAD(P)-dependent oxidoreductase n=1 Tax=Brachybacterium saurashtrense TaxID=556288 RepID=A0A345YQF0_9MICO|nr:SDR family oxidoreductase [Brachybacterium saurashtrense]AXK46152.1 SDR family NAD(P)-dependent oxidoreductase [Brachybacterium saurashtrense]RRR23892.1 SDR family NAD(P)-dependent oxidoreductase [Brachybacterium saurashtrense]